VITVFYHPITIENWTHQRRRGESAGCLTHREDSHNEENPPMQNVLHSFRLDGRLALVTGSSAGIGLAIARGLAQAGARVVLNGRNLDTLQTTAAVLCAEGLDVHWQTFDVTDGDAVGSAVDDIEARLGPLEILVNNAGMQRRGPLEDYSQAHWRELMSTNLESAFLVGQAVARRMIPRGRGRIINVCSVQSELGRPGIAPYAASKGALKMLTKGMAIDWGNKGLTVNGIGPGYFKTELNAALVANPEFSDWLVQRTPSRRWGEVAELAGAAVFLASDASSFVNGHILYVDGGITASL
jgi:gluconate 5-dehydrogenase